MGLWCGVSGLQREAEADEDGCRGLTGGSIADRAPGKRSRQAYIFHQMREPAARGGWPLGDGVVTIRPPRPGEAAVLIAGRDDEWARWLGPGSDDPRPTACIVVDGAIVGWVDADAGLEGLADGEVNIGYNVFAPSRRRGYATRAVLLLIEQLAAEGEHRVAVALIDAENHASQRVARAAGFAPTGEHRGKLRFERAIVRMP